MFMTNNKIVDFKKYKKEQVFNLDIPLSMNAKLIQIRHDSCKIRSVYSNWKVRQVEKDLQMVIEFEKDKFLVWLQLYKFPNENIGEIQIYESYSSDNSANLIHKNLVSKSFWDYCREIPSLFIEHCLEAIREYLSYTVWIK